MRMDHGFMHLIHGFYCVHFCQSIHVHNLIQSTFQDSNLGTHSFSLQPFHYDDRAHMTKKETTTSEKTKRLLSANNRFERILKIIFHLKYNWVECVLLNTSHFDHTHTHTNLQVCFSSRAV